MTPVRTLLVGAGWVGALHREAVTRAGDALVAVVDPDRERRVRLAEGTRAETFAELAHALDRIEVDAAIVASPTGDHVEQAALLAERGIDVLVEKPHRTPDQSGEGLRRFSDGTPVVRVGMTTRHLRGIRALRDALIRRELGDVLWWSDRIRYAQASNGLSPWYFTRARSGGGILLTNGVHALDRARWLLASPLELTQARTWRLTADAEVEHAAEVTLRAGEGPEIRVELLWAPYAVEEGELLVSGTGGWARVRQDGSWTLSTRAGEVSGRAEEAIAPFARQWLSFKDAVAGGADLLPGPEEAERVLELVADAYRSAEESPWAR